MSNIPINIVYSCDDNFIEILGVSLVSLFRNNKLNRIRLFILDFNISLNNKILIENICKENGRRKPFWLKAINIQSKIGNKIKSDRGSLSQYARLFLSDVIPCKIKKVIYLDCDTLILSDLGELFNLNLGECTIGALKDCFSKYYRAPLGLNEEDLMFNSGVMLIDLYKWRIKKVEEQFESFIKKRNGSIMQGDQGVLNAILSHETLPLDPKYNLISILYELSYRTMKSYRRPVNFYDNNTLEIAKNNPVIIHFTSSFYSNRPWEKNCRHPYANLWRNYKNTSSFLRNYKQIKSKNNVLFTLMPTKILLTFASIAQIYVKPMIYRRPIK